MVKWSIRNRMGCVQRGEMPPAQIQKCLKQLSMAAMEKEKETEAAHVLYGIKIYREDGMLETVQFYMEPMGDREFYRMTGKIRNAVVYAVHNHRKCFGR